jgi:hypothetical protein
VLTPKGENKLLKELWLCFFQQEALTLCWYVWTLLMRDLGLFEFTASMDLIERTMFYTLTLILFHSFWDDSIVTVYLDA